MNNLFHWLQNEFHCIRECSLFMVWGGGRGRGILGEESLLFVFEGVTRVGEIIIDGESELTSLQELLHYYKRHKIKTF
jgi:hypothetical protein